MYQLEFENIISAESGAFYDTLTLDRADISPAQTWDDLLLRAATIALASRNNHHVIAFDLLLEDPGHLRDFMEQEFGAHPEELLE